jgi:hypothetical protein
MTLECAQCRDEGRPSLLGEIDDGGDASVTYGLCWTHRRRRLTQDDRAPDSLASG